MKFKLSVIFLILFSAAIFPQSDDLYNRFRLAQSYEQAGDILKAKSILEEIYNQEPANYQFFEALSRVYIRLKEFEKAISITEKRLKITPEDINLQGNLGSIFYQKGDEQKAFETWDNAIKLNSNISYRIISNYAIENRAYEKAVEILQKGKEISPDKTSYLFDLGNLYSVLMKYKEAAEEYVSLVEISENQLAAVQGRLIAYVNKPEAYKITVEAVQNRLKKFDKTPLYKL